MIGFGSGHTCKLDVNLPLRKCQNRACYGGSWGGHKRRGVEYSEHVRSLNIHTLPVKKILTTKTNPKAGSLKLLQRFKIEGGRLIITTSRLQEDRGSEEKNS